MQTRLHAACWPAAQLGGAIDALIRRFRGAPTAVTPAMPPWVNFDDDAARERWIGARAAALGCEAEPIETDYAGVIDLIRSAAPAILRITNDDGPAYLAVIRGGRRTVCVLTPELSVKKIPIDDVHRALCELTERPYAETVDALLSEIGASPRVQRRARREMVRQQLGSVRIDAGWLIRPAPHTSFLRHIVQAGSIGHIAILLGAHAAQFGLFLLSWWVIGSATLGGRLSRAVLGAWALLMLALIPIRLIEAWAQGRLAIGVGGLLKQRLLHGAFQIEPERVRSRGAGQLLGAVMESEAVANLALGGALTGVTVVVELFIAAFVLAVGPGGGLRVALYALWLLLTAFWAARYLRSRSRWTVARVAMTNDLIERMVGHRTRLAQEVPEHWHDGEDEALQGYYATSHQVDRRALVMQAFVGRGWTVVGLLGATPLILGHASPGVTAAALGGIILASTALAKTMAGINQIADALIAWRQIAPLYAAAGNRAASGSTSLAMPPATNAAHPADHPLLEAFDLAFRYRPAGKPIVDNCRLQINGRDRVLLEGPSGGGKSTLAALLVGLKSPESGLLLLKGLDRQSWGADAWRRQVVVAPQFHENHVLTGTFAFNLLMGVAWPATPADMARAAEICRELGLDEVLARMPAGLHQMLGESGWQLSHGERSRLYIARALLQNPDLIILDESFAALDPHTLHRCLQAVDRRAKALLVIAHP